MSWSDPGRRFEPAEDVELRSELRELLGLGAEPVSTLPDTEPTPELRDLAEDLRREAERRRRTYPFRTRPSWKLLSAAALPFVLGLAGAGAWGLQQKHRADDLAQAVAQKESDMRRASMEAEASKAELARERSTREQVQQQLVMANAKLGQKPSYLVVPVPKPLGPETTETLRVKAKP
ncbi:MAG TPA: hypothetical protein VJ483_05305 [Holophagaceae bacterium]|nr:hypothetical protein [Holophagaceae bacterium]